MAYHGSLCTSTIIHINPPIKNKKTIKWLVYKIINKIKKINWINNKLNKIFKNNKERSRKEMLMQYWFSLQRVFTVLICNFVLKIEIVASCWTWMLFLKENGKKKKLCFWFGFGFVRMKIEKGKESFFLCFLFLVLKKFLFFAVGFFSKRIFFKRKLSAEPNIFVFIGNSQNPKCTCRDKNHHRIYFLFL